MHSLITPAGAIALGIGWLAGTLLLGALVLARGAWLTDVLAVAAASALVAALNGGTGSNYALALLLAPLCCVAVGVLTFRAAGVVLRGAERVARSGPVLPRLASSTSRALPVRRRLRSRSSPSPSASAASPSPTGRR